MGTAEALTSFSDFFSHRVTRFELDFSESSMIDVIEAYEVKLQKTSPKTKLSHIISRFQDIEKEVGQKIMPDDINEIFYGYFIELLYEQGITPNSADNYCSSIRACLKWASRHKCPLSSTFDMYKINKTEPLRIALTADEISHIAHFDVQTIKRRPQYIKTMEKVRDQFVLQTCLYQRYSDASRVSPDNFSDMKYSVVQKKTGNKAYVDIDKYSILPKYITSLLKKYNYKAPYDKGINAFNRYLHELLQYIGEEFNETVVKEYKIKGEIVRKEIPRWKAIASHCARRTAITYGVHNAKTETEIRRCSGHKGGGRDAFHSYIVMD